MNTSIALTAAAVLISSCVFVWNLAVAPTGSLKQLNADLTEYVRTGAIAAAPNDHILDLFAANRQTQKIAKWTIRNLTWKSLGEMKRFGYKQIAFNEMPQPQRLGIFFIDPNKDPKGIIERYNVWSATSIPSAGIVLVNMNYIRKIIVNSPDPADVTVGNDFFDDEGKLIGLTAEQNRDPPVGAGTTDYVAIVILQNIMISTYVVLHEVGHIFEYHTRQASGITKSFKERELIADDFFARMVANLPEAPDGPHLKEMVVTYYMSMGFNSFLSSQLRDQYGVGWMQLYTRDPKHGPLVLKSSVLAQHPPLAYRLIILIHRIYKEFNRTLSPGAPRFFDEYAYESVISKKIVLTWSLLP